ncbi:coiled-coil domain-containing protein [Leptotrichia hongkongensis]|uniref:coiled-coil domain-containing protein n=1 Tax=Leptotrichia hongkongensis TaxID=554406 RepID=UPI0035A89417
MDNKKKSNNCFFVGGDDWIENKEESIKKIEKERYKNKIKLFLKKYLLLDNVNFLFGTGSSIHLGAESIQEIPKQISEKIEKNDDVNNLFKKLKEKYEDRKLLDVKEEIEKGNDYLIWENKINNLEEELKSKLKEPKIQKEKVNLKEIIVKNELDDSEKEKIYKLGVEVKLEDFLNYLYALKYLMEQSEDLISKVEIDLEKLEQLIETIKKAIFEMCDIDKISFDDNHFLKKEENKEIKDKMEKEGRYTYHKSLLTSLLQRPLNLRRANIFTLNYDLAFEYACDELGIEYINGFVGFNERNFRPEVYNYDFFFLEIQLKEK